MAIFRTQKPIRRALITGVGAIAALTLTSCGLTSAGGSEDRTISIIVTESAPYQEPTEIAKDLLAEDGWTLEPTYVTDIVQPNQVVSQGEYDANFFQHLAYLRQFNTDNGTEVEPAFSTYYSSSGVFSLEYDSFDELPDGAEISLPVDTANNGRGIKLLAEHGLLEIDESIPVTELSQADITSNPKNLEFIEIDQQSSAHTLSDVDAGFAFARLIAEAGHDIDETALALEEDEEVRRPYTNVVAVQPGDQASEKTQALQDAYQSPEVQEWFEDYLEGATEYNGDITTDDAQETWSEFTAE
ncbi:MetQ/NlpA family ABC transporter substrate-binding protein [Yaniella flava]|uniref:MetQ/NlpA family ABC transporter substrate-binding protein n=1 Tax=Yaniella flava TaxID=287930 RepID=A0ABP5FLE8_9MICC